MRELEFLPAWYPQTIRRQRIFKLQLGLTIVLALGLGSWLLLSHRNLSRAQGSVDALDQQLAQSQLELDQLQTQLHLQGQLKLQQQIVSRLGVPVEMSRLLRTLDALMPKEMSLVELSFDTQEMMHNAPGAAVLRARVTDKDQPRDRSLHIRLVAVAPSDIDLANFLAGLTGTAFFQEVHLNFSRDKAQGGHLLREFEVTFTMNLNSPMGS